MPLRPPRYGSLLLVSVLAVTAATGVVTIRSPSRFRAETGDAQVICACPCIQMDADACADQGKKLFSLLLEDPMGTCSNYCEAFGSASSQASSSLPAGQASASASASASSSSASASNAGQASAAGQAVSLQSNASAVSVASAASSSPCAACSAACSLAGSPYCDFQNQPTCASTIVTCSFGIPSCDAKGAVFCSEGGTAVCPATPSCLQCTAQQCTQSHSTSSLRVGEGTSTATVSSAQASVLPMDAGPSAGQGSSAQSNSEQGSASAQSSASGAASSICAACSAACSMAGSPYCDFQNQPTCASTAVTCSFGIPSCDVQGAVLCSEGGAAGCPATPSCLQCAAQQCVQASSAQASSLRLDSEPSAVSVSSVQPSALSSTPSISSIGSVKGGVSGSSPAARVAGQAAAERVTWCCTRDPQKGIGTVRRMTIATAPSFFAKFFLSAPVADTCAGGIEIIKVGWTDSQAQTLCDKNKPSSVSGQPAAPAPCSGSFVSTIQSLFSVFGLLSAPPPPCAP